METVRIKDKEFRVSIPAEKIQERVKAVAEQINRDMEGKNPLLIAVLNGAFMFAADLMRNITIPCEISFVKLASYQGTTTTGTVKACRDAPLSSWKTSWTPASPSSEW